MPLDLAKIKALRDRLGLTQAGAAHAAGQTGLYAKMYWYKIESGEWPDPRLSKVEAIARALRCRVDDLLLPDPLNPQKRQKRSLPSGSAGSKG